MAMADNHIDLLLLQSADIELTSTGLILRSDLPYEQWEAIGVALQRLERTIQFALGDWLNYGDTAYGEKYAQAIEQTEHSYGTLMNYAYVAKHVEISLRSEILGYSHHKEVAPLEPELQEEYLNWAVSEGATVKELRWKIRRDQLSVADVIPDENTSRYDVQPGQVWTCGRHTVYCGDAYALLPTLGWFDAIITDPPYGIDYKPNWNKWDGRKSDFNQITGDDQPFNPLPFLDAPTVLLFGANYYAHQLPIGGWLCWDKRTKEELDNMIGSPFELAWYRSVHTTRKTIMVRILHGGVVNADSIYGNNEKRHHATQKPVVLMGEIITQLTKPEEIVLDPFAGSGSTLLACEKHDRNCIAIEIDVDYVEIILQRWQLETGGIPCQV